MDISSIFIVFYNDKNGTMDIVIKLVSQMWGYF